jgi:multidrug efflux pump
MGLVEAGARQWWIYANDQAFTAQEYIPMIVSHHNGAAVRLADVAEVVDSVQDKNNAAVFNNKPAVLLILYREPNANILETVQRVQDLMPWLSAAMPAAMEISVAMERTATIRGSIREVERTLIIAVGIRVTSSTVLPKVLAIIVCPGTRAEG